MDCYSRAMPEPTPERSVHEGTSDIAMVNEAWRRAEGNGVDRELAARQIAMDQRVIAALERFNTKSDKWSRRLFWANGHYWPRLVLLWS
jgi:hypothetical protein